MKVPNSLTNLFLFSLILLLGVSPLLAAPGAKKSYYYLGALAEGYPQSMVISEFQYASAEVVNIKDNWVLFGINEKTKLTTFFKNLPFLKEVYVDAESLKGRIALNTNPLAREFLFLLQEDKAQPGNPPRLKDPDSQDTGPIPANNKGSAATSPTLEKNKTGNNTGLKTSPNNMAAIDKRIREKAEQTRKLRASQGSEK